MRLEYGGFEEGAAYHVFTRGVEKRKIFLDHADRLRFKALLLHCLPNEQILSFSHAQKLKRIPMLTEEGGGLVDILCYCLMDNHIHLLLRENVDGGISLYMQRLLNSFAKYFNVRHDRTGALFGSRFKMVSVVTDDQLLHVSRYIHLNPYVARIVNNAFTYPWSSLREYSGKESKEQAAHRQFLSSLMDAKEYGDFILNQMDYEQSLASFPELLLDDI